MVKPVLFTAPETYHTSLHEAFNKKPSCNFQPILLPLISSTLLSTEPMFQTFCNQLASFDYIICSSIMAVRALASAKINQKFIEDKIVAIGNDQKAVGQLLDVTPALPHAKPSMMGIVEALQTLPELPSKRIAVLRPKIIGLPVPSTITNFQNALRSIGANVSYVDCYSTTAINQEHYTQVIDMLHRSHIHAIAITSGGEAYVLSRLLSYAQELATPIEIPIYSFGPYTSRCANEAGLSITGTSPKHQSFSDFVDFLNTII